jgi:hypothetical protein
MGDIYFVSLQLQQHGQSRRGIAVVVDDEHARGDNGRGFGARGRAEFGRLTTGPQRQADDKFAAVTETRSAGFRRAVVELYEFLD